MSKKTRLVIYVEEELKRRVEHAAIDAGLSTSALAERTLMHSYFRDYQAPPRKNRADRAAAVAS